MRNKAVFRTVSNRDLNEFLSDAACGRRVSTTTCNKEPRTTCHNRDIDQLQRVLQLWDLDCFLDDRQLRDRTVFSRRAPRRTARPARREINHLVNELQLSSNGHVDKLVKEQEKQAAHDLHNRDGDHLVHTLQLRHRRHVDNQSRNCTRTVPGNLL